MKQIDRLDPNTRVLAKSEGLTDWTYKYQKRMKSWFFGLSYWKTVACTCWKFHKSYEAAVKYMQKEYDQTLQDILRSKQINPFS